MFLRTAKTITQPPTATMALNWTMLSPNRSPVPLPHEMTITNIDTGVDLALTIPDSAPVGDERAGGSGGSKKLKALGKAWLTDQRVRLITLLIFTSDAPTAAFESLSVPLPSVLSTKFEQPTFGPNYLSFDIKPSAEGGLTTGTRAELRFKDRAMFEFVSLLEKTRERAIYMKRRSAEEEEGLHPVDVPDQILNSRQDPSIGRFHIQKQPNNSNMSITTFRAWEELRELLKAFLNLESPVDPWINAATQHILRRVDRDIDWVVTGYPLDDDRQLCIIISFGAEASGEDLEELKEKGLPPPRYLKKKWYCLALRYSSSTIDSTREHDFPIITDKLNHHHLTDLA
ncbi:hypothetical protein DXG01_001595 [Tephrocybe rancida]|nr:hypothetical protein DXG01_001595 [Tephrocybe rancida]